MSSLAYERWRTLAQPLPALRQARGLDALWAGTVGAAARFAPRRAALLRRAERIAESVDEQRSMDDGALDHAIERAREGALRRSSGAIDQDRACALLCVAAERSVGLTPYVEQIAGALALVRGCFVEMATGEGKTLVAALAGAVHGWRARGCHVVTVNGYLAERDAAWMRPFYGRAGVSVGYVVDGMDREARTSGYSCDVTYSTNKEVAADYLRDRLDRGGRAARGGLAAALLGELDGRSGDERMPVMRGLEAVIIDEADSVLVDEAVTPLIISGRSPEERAMSRVILAAESIARGLEPKRDFVADARHREVRLTEAGRARIAVLASSFDEQNPVWRIDRRREEVVAQALNARENFVRDRDYVVIGGSVMIVDESTGRLMPDRAWRDGLHQAVEAKEGLEVRPPDRTLARISFQQYFRLYRTLGGMSGTLRESAPELWRVYGRPVVVLPTHRSVRRKRLPDRWHGSRERRRAAIVEEIIHVVGEGRPVLVGTRNVSESETLSVLLHEAGIAHEVLNAVRHADEARIIERAGRAGQVTVATNMAGRGTDIRLGQGVAERGGLHVIASERHDSARIDRQLFGRAGRQGDPGSAVAYASPEDELFRTHGGRAIASMLGSRGAAFIIRLLQARSEAEGKRRRIAVAREDDWLDDMLGFAGERS